MEFVDVGTAGAGMKAIGVLGEKHDAWEQALEVSDRVMAGIRLNLAQVLGALPVP